MKKLLAFSMALIMLAISSCAAPHAPTETVTEAAQEEDTQPMEQTASFEYNWNDDGVLKILTVGNSFSDDMMEHVYQIAQDIGVERMELGNLVYGGCQIAQHYDFWTNSKPVYDYRTNTDGSWNTQQQATFEAAFQTTDWDYICFQQAALVVQGDTSLYEHLPALIQMARDRCPNAAIIWHMPWANPHANYGQDIDAMYKALCNAVSTIITPMEEIKLVIPCGTAIQNMRTSYAGSQGMLVRDGWHLSQDVGRYIAGLTLVKQLTGLRIDDVTWTPTGRAKGIREICIEAVNNAVAQPLAVTPSAYTDPPDGWRQPL